MEVILTQDVAGIGFKNDTVKVKDGFGRNYLIPRGYGIIANKINRKKTDEDIRQAAHKAEKIKNDAMALAESIGETTLQVGAKVGESGKIFGAVTALQIADALKEKGFEVDRKKISFNSEVKAVGDYAVTLNLHKEVKKVVKFKVIAD